MAHGLVLSLGGAPATPHRVDDVEGLFVPGVPTPVGGDGEVGLDAARALDADPSVPLSLVKVASDVDDLRERQAEARKQSRQAAAKARKHAEGGEVAFIRDEIDATRKVAA